MIGKKTRTFLAVLQGLLIILMTFLVTGMILQINNLQGTARVINYAGLVRGATQREVKLEMAGQRNDELMDYLDDIVTGLRYESPRYNLVRLEDETYLQNLDELIDYWQQLKAEIRKVRKLGYEATDIVDMSETYFQMADDTVSAAEVYSEGIAESIRHYEIMTALDVTLLICIMLVETVDAVAVRRKNRLLEQKAFIDEHTGLPNKGRCELFVTDLSVVERPTACIVFDLNNLKKANDTLGHSVGDQLIYNFARLLRNAIPVPNFVGRYGGDEFMAVIDDATKEAVEAMLAELSRQVDEFNRVHHGSNGFIEISYAYGWALSTELPGCSFRVLFDKADRHMYENKMRAKERRME